MSEKTNKTEITGSITYRRPSLVIFHLRSAIFFAREAAGIEASRVDDSGDLEVNLFSAASVNSSVAFLEATINELLANCHEDYGFGFLYKLSNEDRRSLAVLWSLLEEGSRRVPLLEKFSFTLQLLARKGFDKGGDPWGRTKVLVGLRNYLVHFKPEDEIVESNVDSRPVEERRMEKSVKGRFAFHPGFKGPGVAYRRVLSAGCAIWSVQTSVAFADRFFELLGIPCEYESVRPHLNFSTLRKRASASSLSKIV